MFSFQKFESLSSVFHLVEGFALVMLCSCRLYPRRLAVHILRETKMLLKSLGCSDSDQPVIDVIDQCCPQVVEKCLSMLPPAEKSAILSTSNVDLQWIADRNSCVWTAGNLSDKENFNFIFNFAVIKISELKITFTWLSLNQMFLFNL